MALKLGNDMSDQSNDPNVILKQSDPAAMAREIVDLRTRLASLETNRVVDGGFKGEAPRYRLNEACQLGDGGDATFFAAGMEVEYLGVPNMSMAPLNDPARRATAQLVAQLTEGAQRVATIRGRDFFGLVTDRNVLIDTAMMDARNQAAQAAVPVILAPVPHQAPPAMPHMDEARARQRRAPTGRQAVLSAITPPSQPDGGAPILAPAPSEPRGPGPAVVGRGVAAS